MDTYENEYTPIQKKSPYADSPYECVYTEPAQIRQTYPQAPRKEKSGKGRRFIAVVLILAICCAGTAWGVSTIWQGKMDRMEAAMDDKFAVLEKLFKEVQLQNRPSQLPTEGPMTPGQVYAENVQAVVSVDARYSTMEGYAHSSGSGFIISADGYIVTNFHVIEGASQIQISTYGEETYAAQVIGYDAANDVALLKVEGEDLPFVTMGSSDKLVVGDQVAAIGNPLGELTSTMTVGYISAKDRIVDTDGTVINMLQTDAAINSGNSGGPLFNMYGQVVGITTAKYSGSSNSGATIEGLGFAIPMDDVIGIISDLKTYGYVTGAYLGVYVRDVDASAQSYGLPAGAYVEEVMQGLAADRAGLKAGDIIVNLGGYDVDSLNALTRVLRRIKVGEETSVTVYRNGQKVYLTIVPEEKPVDTQQPTDQTPNAPDGGSFDSWFDDFFGPFFDFD